jgi:redox-sensitive bicupin YhaK (pirin superfamily)
MQRIRRAEDRGHFDHGWLKTWHSFSFAEYQDEQQMGFDTLRVINQDIVHPGRGFSTHGHRDMEIITYVIRGAVEHEDSLGNKEVVPAGDVQRMTAGTGVRHSEFNPSKAEELELLQIWILPERHGLEPGYEQRSVSLTGDGLQLIVSPDGRGDSLKVHQDVEMYAAHLRGGETVRHAIAAGRSAWVQLVHGELQLDDGDTLRPGDGLAVADQTELRLTARSDAELILFDLAPGPLGRGS